MGCNSVDAALMAIGLEGSATDLLAHHCEIYILGNAPLVEVKHPISDNTANPVSAVITKPLTTLSVDVVAMRGGPGFVW